MQIFAFEAANFKGRNFESFMVLNRYVGTNQSIEKLYGRNFMATEKKKTVSKKTPVKKEEPTKETETVNVDTEIVKTEEPVEEKVAEEKTEPKKASTRKSTTRKTTTKKAATKTTTTKQSTSKKTTTKKVPKNVFLECYGQQVKIDVEKYEAEVKNIWLNDWKRLAKDLKEIDIYIKPEDGKAYFVVNGTEHGALVL